MHVRRLEAWEREVHRDVRLRALHEAPESFGETLADAAARPGAYWDELTRSVTEPGRHVMFLACERDEIVGSTYGLVDPERPRAGRVGGMWVDPAWRRRGVGAALLREVVEWARDRRFTHLGLWAPAASPAALALYRRAGFCETGQRRPLPKNTVLEIIEMERRLT